MSHIVVGQLLKGQDYRLQANAKVIEGNQARHQQVEQDRTPPVLIHYDELARTPSDQS